MNYLITLILITMITGLTLYDFNNKNAMDDWAVEDDTVMGGKSQGHLSRTDEGHAKFSGDVSLENNGGFSSIQADFDTKDVSSYSHVVIKLKGDGKAYNFRVKETSDQRHAYSKEFKTSGDWETIKIPFIDFAPTYRGNTLDIPNYSGKTLGHVRFLIGNKKEQSFELLIETIGLE